ncbi:carbohydrate-binding module family 18 protein [Piromyces sp. E2]|nr:carbohydrate-binding module family 18 protein [Piromyces sp. E2]|eukprot:OUM64770.1 carbohydrate-binding module family 18 protein [Piromyces sp. E2]
MGCGISAGNIPCTDNISISTVKDRCGPEYGKCADKNACCSSKGYCDNTDAHCGTGCQPKYGLCGISNVISVSTVKDRCGPEYGKCGPEYGKCADKNACCSSKGYCDNTDAHCGTGCQPKYGLCGISNVISVSTVKDRCGSEYGKCANNNECCSQYGWCGKTSDHCGTGCQPKYGLCGISNVISVSTVKGRCGSDFGKCANNNECCSQYDWCGTTNDHCGNGCQPKYGICK